MDYMPHIHCLNYDWLLATVMIALHTVLQVGYFVVCLLTWRMGNWGIPNGQFRKLFHSLSLVFMFCGTCYMMQTVIIFKPYYHLQTVFLACASFTTLKAVYHVHKMGKSHVMAFIELFKVSIKGAGA